jgi:hypothetical protein
MARPTKLTPDIQQKIVSFIRQGSFDWVGAQAAGIDPATFRRWMAAGREGDSRYIEFVKAVDEARAQARMLAEIEVRQTNPLAWLRYGPGRERPGEPGWTELKQHEVSGPNGAPIPLEMIDRIVRDAAEGEDHASA